MSNVRNFDTDIEKKAALICRAAHDSIQQCRKYTYKPHFTHCYHVARIVKEHTKNTDIICAAYLHDVIEDVFPHLPVFSLDFIRDFFGSFTAQLVHELTDVSKLSDGNRVKRKEIDRLHTMKASDEAKLIKLADLIDNARSIKKHDKKFWKVYKSEVLLLLPHLDNVCDELYMTLKYLLDN